MADEVWLPIAGFEGLYEVSDLGRVRSLDRVTVSKLGRSRFYPGVVLANVRMSDGYEAVSLYRDGKGKLAKVHRLVAAAFLPNPGGKPDIDHRNGVRHDNGLSNIRWATKSENQRNRTVAIGAAGAVGVCFSPDGRAKRYRAYGYTLDERNVTLGHFHSLAEAKAARAKFIKDFIDV